MRSQAGVGILWVMNRHCAILALLAGGMLASPAAGRAERVLSGTNYFHAVSDALSVARTSIDVQMYFIIPNPTSENDPVGILVDGLVAAKKRGVRVRVILENSKARENRQAYRILRASGIDVAFDTPLSLMHSKAIVIDGKVCIVGSTNWSRAAIIANHEVAVLIESRKLATELTAGFEKIGRGRAPPVNVREQKGLSIPHSLLTAGAPLSRMVTDRADYAFDLYLLLLKTSQETKTRTVPFDGDVLKKALGCGNIRRPRLRLVERYQAIAYDKKVQRITLLPREETDTATFVLPDGYWRYALSQRLSLRARFMYLVALAEAARSTRAPFWFRSQKDLAEIYGISDYTVSLGLQELERENIIEIERSRAKLSGKAPSAATAFAARHSNVYCVNPLVSADAFEKGQAELVGRYGKKVMKQATELSSDLNEPKDLTDIDGFARLIVEYGYDVVRNINDVTVRSKKGGGRRTLEHTIELLRGRHMDNGAQHRTESGL